MIPPWPVFTMSFAMLLKCPATLYHSLKCLFETDFLCECIVILIIAWDYIACVLWGFFFFILLVVEQDLGQRPLMFDALILK